MPLSSLSTASKKTVGTKQTLKALEKGLAKTVFVALDAEQHVIRPLIQICQAKNIQVVQVDFMKDLGKACGIEVGCAAAAVVEC
ncbi:ribosomal L7Ae/L30e/S12e/Gadd45 family protein [Phosphitispora sp. TUW77]|uniref:ribosomal L7Ae/L30e/S12e/Gadd45 family protein n=1 Tax=Phosphitispora sp. TUW77 TaxID=3152361 RepID=UPI003AB3C733